MLYSWHLGLLHLLTTPVSLDPSPAFVRIDFKLEFIKEAS